MKCFVSWGKGKQKADKNRARVEENFLKLTHVQRQEAAQSRREEKKRAEKERIMNEEDPEKQRRLEVRQTFFPTEVKLRFIRVPIYTILTVTEILCRKVHRLKV